MPSSFKDKVNILLTMKEDEIDLLEDIYEDVDQKLSTKGLLDYEQVNIITKERSISYYSVATGS